MDYRKPIHDKLITDFSALVFDGTAVNLFTAVQKVFVDEPEDLPVCRIIPVAMSVEVDGNTHDTRILSFSADVFDAMDLESLTNAENKIDRLSNIEDSVVAYLEKLPNNLENEVSGIHIYDIMIERLQYQYQTNERGLEVVLNIPFSLKLSITPQTL